MNSRSSTCCRTRVLALLVLVAFPHLAWSQASDSAGRARVSPAAATRPCGKGGLCLYPDSVYNAAGMPAELLNVFGRGGTVPNRTAVRQLVSAWKSSDKGTLSLVVSADPGLTGRNAQAQVKRRIAALDEALKAETARQGFTKARFAITEHSGFMAPTASPAHR